MPPSAVSVAQMPLRLQVLADRRPDDLAVANLEVADVRGLERGFDRVGVRFEAGALLDRPGEAAGGS